MQRTILNKIDQFWKEFVQFSLESAENGEVIS